MTEVSFTTNITARIAADRPAIEPIDRSISPRRSTSTTPIAMVPTATIWRLRFTRLRLERKAGSRA